MPEDQVGIALENIRNFVVQGQAGEAVGIDPVPWNEDVVMYKHKKKEVKFDTSKIGEIFKVDPRIAITHEHIKQFSKHHPDLYKEPLYQFKDKNTLVGIEVEVENVLFIDPNIPLLFWEITEDGSLRNRGREFRTYPVPLGYVEPALRQLFSGLNEDVDFSRRTSIHVHLDVRQLTFSQAVGLLFTYAAVENVLFKFASGNRRNSIFCVPITETNLLSSFHTKPENLFLNIGNYWQKYTALNLLPISKFGTFEFRQLPGTSNINQILLWLDMLSHLRIYAYRYPLEAIIKTIADLNTSSAYHNFIEDVFGPLSTYLDMSQLIVDMEKPCYVIKNSSVVNSFHHKVVSNINNNSSFAKLWRPKTPYTVSQRKALDYFKKNYWNEDYDDLMLLISDHRRALSELPREREYVNFLLDNGPDPFKRREEQF